MTPIEPLFAGLVVDENDNPVGTAHVGDEPMYVVNDDGFLRHIPAEQIDRAVLAEMQAMVAGNEDVISEQAAKMMGQDDIFSVAMFASQLKNMDKQFDLLLKTGIPEEGRAYLGMAGFRIRINLHGEVIEVVQPGMVDPGDE